MSNEEIERIGKVQFEDREHIVRFLSSEGKLSDNNAFRKRMRRVCCIEQSKNYAVDTDVLLQNISSIARELTFTECNECFCYDGF